MVTQPMASMTDIRGVAACSVDETAPDVAALIAENDVAADADTADGAAVAIAQAVAHGIVGLRFGFAAPDIAEFVSEADKVAVSGAMDHFASSCRFEAVVAVSGAEAFAASVQHAQFIGWRGCAV